MLRENQVFVAERNAGIELMYPGAVYTLGTFVPEDLHKVNHNFVQMVPTENSRLMFDTVRSHFGLGVFEEEYVKDPTVYTASGKTSMVLVNELFGVAAPIKNMAVEYLDTIGMYVGKHSIRLVELESEGTYYYVLVGGKGAIEAKADELFNADKAVGEVIPFKEVEGQGVHLDGVAMLEFVLSLVNDSFEREWTLDDSITGDRMFGVHTPYSYDMGELNQIEPIDSVENWLEVDRLGVVFSVKKKG